MKIYVNAVSKNSITYTPDVLVIETNGKTYEYDINGTVEYDEGGLNCKVRGDLEIRDEKTDEFRPITTEEAKQLLILLSGFTENKKVSINVYPMLDNEEEEFINSIENDTLGKGSAAIEFNANVSVNFEFQPVFVGF